MRTLIAILIVASASPAAAQIIQPPPRSTGGLFGGRQPADPNRTSQELTLTMQLLAGYDDPLTGAGALDAPEQSGYIGSADGTIRYWRGRSVRSFETSGRAYISTNMDLGLDQLVGGDVNGRGMTELGRQTRLSVSMGLRYEPTFLLSDLSIPGSAVEPGQGPNFSATQGVTEQRWLTLATAAGLSREWTARHQTSLESSFSKLQPLDTGLDSQTLGASVSHVWSFRQNASFQFSYNYSDQLTFEQAGDTRPVQSHTANMGLTVRKRWSETRRLEISGGGGATQAQALSTLDDQPTTLITPSVYGTVALDLMRTWAVSANVGRDVSILQGLSPQPFITQTASFSVGGRVARRFEVVMRTGFSQGAARDGEAGSFEASTGTAQVQWSVSRWLGIVTNYSYSNHLLRDIASLTQGFPTRYNRHSVRLGLTVRLPLYGTFSGN